MSSKRVKRPRKAKAREVSTPPPAPSQLANLPDELLLVVIDYLSIRPTFGKALFPTLDDDPGRRHALASLCLTNKRLASFAKPALWRHPVNRTLKQPGLFIGRLMGQCLGNGHLVHSLFDVPYNGEANLSGLFNILLNLEILTVNIVCSVALHGNAYRIEVTGLGLQQLKPSLSLLKSLRYLTFGNSLCPTNPWSVLEAIPEDYSGWLQLGGLHLTEHITQPPMQPVPIPKPVAVVVLHNCYYDNQGLSALLGNQPRTRLSIFSLEQCNIGIEPDLSAIAALQTSSLKELRYIASIIPEYPTPPMPMISNLVHLEKLCCSLESHNAPFLLNLPTSLRTVHIVELDKSTFSLINDHIASLPNLQRLIVHLDGPILNDHAKVWRPYINKNDWNAIAAEALKLEETCRVRRVELWPSDIALAMKAVRRGKGEAYRGPW